MPSPKDSKDGAPPPGKAEAGGDEEHVSGPPEKKTLFGSLKKMGMSARESVRNLKDKYVPGKDVGDGPEPVKVEDRPKTGSSKIKSSTDDDGPVWEPGTEQLMWTDPKYVVTSYVVPGVHPNHSKHFVKPEKWWQSAEDAMKMLEQERRGLKAASLDQQNLLARTMLATNRFISTRLQETMTVAKKGDKGFRGGIEPIQHVLPPDVQRALHSKLCAAIKQGENQVMTMLLRFDIDLDYSDPFGTPLHYAANFGQLQAAHLLLEKGSFPGAVNYREQTPLHMAASKNASTVVDLLVRYGAPLNATEMGGSTAMHIACTNGFVKVVEILIMGGADCDKPNRIGWSPLHLACLGMHHDVIEKLCISGMCNPNSTCSITKEVRVGKSSYASKFQVVKGDTPGHFAARLAYFMCLKVLLENGGDPCAQNERGETMMHLAVQTADMRCVERILEYGWGFIDLEDHLGRDPIDVCDDKLAEHEGDEPEDVSVRKIVNAMKTLLQRTSVLKNRAAHKELMEQAKRGVGGRKKNLGDAPPAIEEGADEKNLELEETPMDDRTMEEKITAMKIELEASRAEARAAEAQSRMKTYNLNEALLETKRRLVESEFMLERERESRLALEQDVLGLIGAQEEEENEKGRASEYSEQSSRAGTAQGSYEKGKTYESLRLQSAQGDADATWRMQRQSSGMMKKEFGRSFSGTQGVRFAESDPDLDEELEKYERAEASSMRAESLSQEPVRSRAGRETYSGRGAHEIMPVEEEFERRPTSDYGRGQVPRTLSNVTFQGVSHDDDEDEGER